MTIVRLRRCSRHLRPALMTATVGLALTLAASAAVPHSGSHFAAGVPGDPRKAARTVKITMHDEGGRMSFSPDRIEVRQGEQIRFVLFNAGSWDHEFMIDSFEGNRKHKAVMEKHPEMVHDDPNGKTLGVMDAADLVWRFTKTGTFEFACLMPGHYDAGMKGVIVVVPRKARGSR